jgi:hypothetical protein
MRAHGLPNLERVLTDNGPGGFVCLLVGWMVLFLFAFCKFFFELSYILPPFLSNLLSSYFLLLSILSTLEAYLCMRICAEMLIINIMN